MKTGTKILRDLFCSLFVISLLLLTVIPSEADFTACAGDYGSITEMINAIPENAGLVTLRLWRSIFEESDAILEIPADRGITGIIFEPDEGIEHIALPGLFRICANGIPLTLSEGLVFENGNIYGGACVSEGEAHLERSEVTVKGEVAFVFGGGFAENGALSVVDEPSVVVSETGSVYFEAFGGGHAYGSGSRVASVNTNVQINGTADYVLGGGFGEDGGTSECEQTFVTMAENARAGVALFSGGSASGKGSTSIVENAKALLYGSAASAFSGDFALNGGITKMNQSSRLEILTTGTAKYVYMGSLASDPGSDAWVNTSELMNCGSVTEIYKKSQSADNAEARTVITAHFPCQ